MLQDLDFGRLDNQYCPCPPEAGDAVVCFRGDEVLLCRDALGGFSLPRCEQAEPWQAGWESWGVGQVRYAFQMQEVRYFLWMGEAGMPGDGRFAYEKVAALRQQAAKNVCFAVMTAWHIFTWYRNSRFCGRCGGRTVHDDRERMMRCPACGNLIYPRIAPAVIVAVTHGDRLILSRYANRSFTRYGLIAGFVEIGETAEEAAAREVMEEVGLRVKNIRYYKSQPWGVAGNLSIGYFCDLEGEDAITLDRQELSSAEWFHRKALPARDDGISLTREMIRVFEKGREPK